MPLSTPERVEVGVNAADVDLKVSILVEAQAGPCRAISEVVLNVGIHSGLNASSIKNGATCSRLVNDNSY